MNSPQQPDSEQIVCLNDKSSADETPPPSISPPATAHRIYRHSLPVRAGHWVNAFAMIILIMSGFQIFNAHPALYWDDRSDREHPFLSIRAMREGDQVKGITTVQGFTFDTTGVLGYSNHSVRAFPSWATIPGPQWLAMGRQWHLFFAWVFVINGVLFALYALVSRHITRDLLPNAMDLRGIGRSVKDHLQLRHPRGEGARRYNVLQKLAYIVVLFGLAPLIVLTGLAMSPTLDAAFPWLLTLFGGRQAARTIHFLACFSFIGFILTHVSQVILTGLINNLRSMVTGWFTIRDEGVAHAEQTPH